MKKNANDVIIWPRCRLWLITDNNSIQKDENDDNEIGDANDNGVCR